MSSCTADAAKMLLVNSEDSKKLLKSNDKCDKLDYLAAIGCGALGGIIDIFLLGDPASSKLVKWTDTLTDNAVMKFAKLLGWKDNGKTASAIGFLEKKFPVNYDQRHTADVGGQFVMSAKDHHLMSLAHSPDIIGLFFSILAQFISKAAFVANGQIIFVDTKTQELYGGNLIAKLFCGIANWFGHVMSDVAGSSGATKRGSGVAIPFYELLQFCNFGKFNVGKDKQDLATIARRAFAEGYDFRFGMAMAVPILITDLSIRLIWALRRHFEYGYDIKDCIPNNTHPDLRIMLMFGNGTLCIMDGLDALIRSGGNALAFFMRLNLIAWFKLIMMILKEIVIRLGIQTYAMVLEAYKRINAALSNYISELEKIDIAAFKRETEEYNKLTAGFKEDYTVDGLNVYLNDMFEKMGWNKPWQGDFGEHMSNKKARLVFE